MINVFDENKVISQYTSPSYQWWNGSNMQDMEIIGNVTAALLAPAVGNFLVYDFWTPPLLSILYMGLTGSFLT